MNNTTKKSLTLAHERAIKIHEQVCDIHYDYSVMNRDGTCSECQDDHHELEILTRTN